MVFNLNENITLTFLRKKKHNLARISFTVEIVRKRAKDKMFSSYVHQSTDKLNISGHFSVSPTVFGIMKGAVYLHFPYSVLFEDRVGSDVYFRPFFSQNRRIYFINTWACVFCHQRHDSEKIQRVFLDPNLCSFISNIQDCCFSNAICFQR